MFKRYKFLFEQSNDPQYILDLESQIFLEANQAFLELCGYSREELVGKLKATEITAPNYQPRLTEKIGAAQKGVERERYEFGILTKSGEVKPVEISVRRFTLDGRSVTLGSVRDISGRLALEKDLRQRITEIAFAGNRLMALTEKIKNVPLLTSSLLDSQSEAELCERAIGMLCDPQGLRYKEASIYFVKEGYLKLAKSSKVISRQANRGRGLMSKRISLRKEHRFVLIVRGDAPPVLEGKEILLPLRGRDQTLGLIRVVPDPKEQELMAVNPAAQKGYQDVFETIVSSLGLLVENLRLNKTLEEQSIHDELTRIYNRRYFYRALREEIIRSHRYSRKLSLLLVDLNKFKEINDTYGHKQGDVILAEVAGVLKDHSRKIDSVCRYGGDEFVVLLPETGLSGALIHAQHLYDRLKKHHFTNTKYPKKPFRIRASFGVSSLFLTPKITSEEALLAAVDKALYQAKRARGVHIKASN